MFGFTFVSDTVLMSGVCYCAVMWNVAAATFCLYDFFRKPDNDRLKEYQKKISFIKDFVVSRNLVGTK